MKFTTEHFEDLKNRVRKINERLSLNNLIQAYKDENIGNDPWIRVHWDIFWATKFSQDHRDEKSYMDTHILTAIKQAVKEVIQEAN